MIRMNDPGVVIIGSGVMGLSMGQLLSSSVIYEKSPFIGGISRTIEHKGFHFDTGLHIMGDLHAEVKTFLMPFLGDNLRKIRVSKDEVGYIRDGVFQRGAMNPHDIRFKSHPILAAAVQGTYYLRRIFPKKKKSVENALINYYGDSYFRWFVKKHVEKYLGLSVNQVVAPKEEVFTSKEDPFLVRLVRWLRRGCQPPPSQPGFVSYPMPWFGAIVEKLSQGLPIRCSAELTKVHFSGKRVTAIEINHRETIPCSHLILALPYHTLIPLLNPPVEIQQQASAIRHRAFLYVALFFAAEQVVKEYSLMALGSEVFYRAFEPKNFGENMAPPGKTSVCFEIYCFQNDPIWEMPDQEVIHKVTSDFRRSYPAPEPFDGVVYRVPRARQVYDAQLKPCIKTLDEFASSFENLYVPSTEYLLQPTNVDLAVQEALRLARKIGAMENDRATLV